MASQQLQQRRIVSYKDEHRLECQGLANEGWWVTSGGDSRQGCGKWTVSWKERRKHVECHMIQRHEMLKLCPDAQKFGIADLPLLTLTWWSVSELPCNQHLKVPVTHEQPLTCLFGLSKYSNTSIARSNVHKIDFTSIAWDTLNKPYTLLGNTSFVYAL